jgi:alpha-ketoglutarate-dependent taurine dioxygenase
MLTDNNQIVNKDNFVSSLEDKEIFEASKIDISQATLKIRKVAELSEPEQQKLFDIFNKFKFVILQSEPLLNPQENLLGLKKFFGSIIKHKRSDENGIVSVENLGDFTDSNSQLLSASNQMFSMHTDGTYENEPPRVVAMQCITPSKNGGLSQIVYGESVYEYLMENHFQELQNLLAHTLTITRGDQTATRAIFLEKEGRISITFRADSLVSIAMTPEVKKAFNLLKEYVNSPNNQLRFKLQANQILLLDNTSVLHGRTSFPDNEVRKLNRLCFDGISEYSHHIKFGFIPKTKILNS